MPKQKEIRNVLIRITATKKPIVTTEEADKLKTKMEKLILKGFPEASIEIFFTFADINEAK